MKPYPNEELERMSKREIIRLYKRTVEQFNDAVPVIRCKDCKYYNSQQHYCEGIGNWFGYVGEWSDNGYCYKAERKEQ